MKRFNFIALVALCVASFAVHQSFSQYWFQSGAIAGSAANFNNGASISIYAQAQSPQYSSYAFWVGEHLANSAFLQIGYMVLNETGLTYDNCTSSGCSSSITLQKGTPYWFFEYFYANAPGSSFLGRIGSSHLLNGSFNNFSFNYSPADSKWHFYVNNNNVGGVNLGSSNSGSNIPAGLAEYANASTNTQYMTPVKFKNMKFYKNNMWNFVTKAYSVISYGYGSETALSNPYGVQEISNKLNDFIVGSGLSLAQNNVLWNVGYSLSIISKYPINGSGNYSAYSSVAIVSNKTLYLNQNRTARAILEGYAGEGYGSYTGNDTNITVQMYNNIKEYAIWQVQYLVNASSEYGNVSGSGWYNANSTASIALNKSLIQLTKPERAVLSNWEYDSKSFSPSLHLSVKVNSPKNITATWHVQYLVNATSQYGNVSGSGWYDANSTANISVSGTVFYQNSTSRHVLNSWEVNNKILNYSSRTLRINVDSPKAVSAVFSQQFFVSFEAKNAYDNRINAAYFYINGSKILSGEFFAESYNKAYNVISVYYKNVTFPVNSSFNVTGPKSVSIALPVYNVTLSAKGVFNTAVNASAEITFKNGTTSDMYLGANGIKTIPNVPYGFSTGTIKYFGYSYRISTANGQEAKFTFISPLFVLFIALVIFLGIILYEVRKHFLIKSEDRMIDDIIKK
ncbi:MAG: hypothetical protein M1331_02060 [Candidatus Marsarchaeota archaeon]|nr:hypothetical protein [Candidatus Marsarchaeota archaeon]